MAIAGATGEVGREMISILASRNFPVGNIYPLASGRERNRTVNFKGQDIEVGVIDEFDFSQAQLALFSMNGEASRIHAPRATKLGCLVVDNSSAYRQADDVPLVIVGVNDQVLDERPAIGIVANPNCSTMQLLLPLKAIHTTAGIERLYVATYQSVSGAGHAAIKELEQQTKALLSGQEPVVKKFSDTIAFNVIPHIDTFQDNGFTREEMKIVWETHKILDDPDINVSATAVRVPVFYGHSEAVFLTTRDYLGTDAVRKLMETTPGVSLLDTMTDGGYPTPLTHAAGSDDVYVGRIRDDIWERCGLHMWITADNIRKGAALNAVQLAELLAQRHL